MTLPMRLILSLALVAVSACATPPRQPAPPTATPQQLYDRVGAFAQPTHDGRLAALKAQLDAAGLPFTVEDFDGKRLAPARGHNVVVHVGPTMGREILLVAHYDAVVLQSGKLVDGMVDNAGSVVAMIEATKRVAGRTRHPVCLILTDQEELGLVGAKAWIDAHGIDNIAATIVGDVNANGDTLMYGLNSGAQSKFLTEAADALCTARAMSCLAFPEYPPSDDQAFSAAGAPALSIGFQPKAEAEKLRAFMLAPQTATKAGMIPEVLMLIHTPNDTLAKVEPAALAAVADFVAALVMKLDGELP